MVFKRFRDKGEAEAILQALKTNHIEYECDEFTDRYFRIELGDAGAAKGFFVKLQPENFEKARMILRTEAKKMMSNLPDDYYLYAFSAKELVEIVQQPEDWNELDYELAKQLLAEGGIEISAEQEAIISQKRDAERTKPIAASWQMIVMGFLLLPFLYGVVIGWEMMSAQKVLSNGQKVYVYEENSRRIGTVLVAMPIVVILGLIVWAAVV